MFDIHPQLPLFTLLTVLCINSIWGFMIWKTNHILPNKTKKVYGAYVALILLWILENAYFQSPLLLSHSHLAKPIALLANITTSCSFMFFFWFSHLIKNGEHDPLAKWQKVFMWFILFESILFNIIPNGTISHIVIDGIGNFTIVPTAGNDIFFLSSLCIFSVGMYQFFQALQTNKENTIASIKTKYILMGMSILYSSIILFHVIIPTITQSFSFVWVPPAFSILEISLVSYALIASKFPRLSVSIYNIAVPASTLCIYLALAYISKQTHENLGITLVSHYFILLAIIISVFLFWNTLYQKASKLWSHILFQDNFSPIENILRTDEKIYDSLEKGFVHLAKTLQVPQAELILPDNQSFHDFNQVFTESNQQNRAFVRDQIEYDLSCSRKKNTLLSKLQKTLKRHNSGLAYPLFDKVGKLSAVIELKKKKNKKPFYSQEINALESLCKKTAPYILSTAKKNPKREECTTPQSHEEFIDALSHELYHPIMILNNSLDFLDLNKLSDEEKDVIQTIRESSTDLHWKIEKILEAYQWQNKLIPLQTSKIDIQSLLEYVLEDLKDEYENIQDIISLKVDPKCSSILLELDVTHFKRALYEIIKNSIFFNHSKRKNIHISANTQNNTLHIDITDNGIGIPESEWRSIFRMMRVLSFSRNREESGIGTGLTIAQQIIEQHDGNITITKSSSHGTNILITLPH